MQREKFGHVQIPFKRIHIELTNVCDFNCVFCPKSLMTRRYGYMDEGLARRIITDIRTYGLAEKITFHVMGEPTLHPKFFSLLDHAASEGMPVGLTTNGGGLGGRIGAELLGHPLHQVDVSLQTPDETSFALRKANNADFRPFFERHRRLFFRVSRKTSSNHFQVSISQYNHSGQDDRKEERPGPCRILNPGTSEGPR